MSVEQSTPAPETNWELSPEEEAEAVNKLRLYDDLEMFNARAQHLVSAAAQLSKLARAENHDDVVVVFGFIQELLLMVTHTRNVLNALTSILTDASANEDAESAPESAPEPPEPAVQ